MDLFLVFGGSSPSFFHPKRWWFGTLRLAGHGIRQVSPHAFHQVDGQLRKRGGGVKYEFVEIPMGWMVSMNTTWFCVWCVFFCYLLKSWSCNLVVFLFPSILRQKMDALFQWWLVDTCRFGGFSVPLSQQQKPGWTETVPFWEMRLHSSRA